LTPRLRWTWSDSPTAGQHQRITVGGLPKWKYEHRDIVRQLRAKYRRSRSGVDRGGRFFARLTRKSIEEVLKAQTRA
jgi:hypothetical protein